MTIALEEVAHRMFMRNVADYAEPALAELAWIDQDIRSFWIQQAEAVAADLTDLTDSAEGATGNTDTSDFLSNRSRRQGRPRRPSDAHLGRRNRR
jgi:hypothetical protein